MDTTELLDRFRPLLAGSLVATDFDGTLAPLQRDPQDSRPAEGAVASLVALSRLGARVAVITGRDAATVVRLGGLARVPGLRVAGLYGLETWQDGALTSPQEPEAITSLRTSLPDVLAAADADPALWIEDKRLSLVVHARKAEDPDAALAAVTAPVTELAGSLGLEVHPGAQVLEVRLPGFDKAGALRTLVTDLSPTAVLYLGDDLGDLPAFAEIQHLRTSGLPAWSVAVTSSGVADVASATDVTVPEVTDAVALLQALAG